jgi:4-hydroxy-tetrahydrodipicolinate reductase
VPGRCDFKMVNIFLSGCNGKMGQVITRLAALDDEVKIAGGLDINTSIKNDYPVFTDLANVNVRFDVILDFSHPSVFDKILEFALKTNKPLVMATTGLSSEQKMKLRDAGLKIPVLFSANMSLGINLLVDLVKRAAKALYGNFDIEIIEKHHNQKIDAPSGTALVLADEINSVIEQKCEYVYDRHSKRRKRNSNEIGIHAVRGGTIVGEHSVIFAGTDEIIEINHRATSKDIFGVGALRASKFIYHMKPGFYSMNDMFNEL